LGGIVYVYETHTEKGLKYLNWCLLLYLIFLGIGMFLTALIFLFFPDIIAGGITPGRLAPFLIVIGISIGLMIIMLIVFVFFLIGIVNMSTGKREFGPQHERNVRKAIIFLISVIILFVVQMIVSVWTVFSIGFAGGLDTERLRIMLIPTVILSFIGALLISLMLVYLVLDLFPMGERNFLWLALAVNVLGTFGASLLTLIFLPSFQGAFPFSWGPTTTIPAIFNYGLSFLAFLIFLYCYRKAYNRVRKREILPVWQPPPTYPTYPPYFPPPG